MDYEIPTQPMLALNTVLKRKFKVTEILIMATMPALVWGIRNLTNVPTMANDHQHVLEANKNLTEVPIMANDHQH